MRFNHGLMAITAALGLMLGSAPAMAATSQSSQSNSLASYQYGYGASRYTTARPSNGSTRDTNGNRLVVDGIIQSGASSYSSGSGSASAGATAGQNASQGGASAIGGATAIGNSLNVVVQGNRNTVVVNSNQTNNGNVSAGTVLNGTLVF